MDIREATWYSNWKTGIELKLYDFQLAQANKGNKLPDAVKMPEAKSSDGFDLSATMPDPDEWTQLDLDLTEDMGNKKSMPQASTKPPSTTIQPTHKPMQPTMVPDPSSTATIFMKSRPGGQVEAMDRDMKVVERCVSSQLQKKGTTSTQGRNALDAIAATVAGENKENECTIKLVSKRKQPSEDAVLKTRNKKSKGGEHQAARKRKAVKSAPIVKDKKVSSVLACKYGCHHGGLVELIQMIPKHTKYHLERGNYFHGKRCKDCKASIGELSGKTKSKGIFYYCHMDNKVADLSDDDQEKEATACACILCLTCYYSREAKKQLATGKLTRSSGRGRA